jgi:two-component system CheB/CheR fusion protein
MRILVVDDSVDTLRMLSRLLRTEGAFVESATEGLEAIRLAEKGAFDLLLCDISMPGMDGYEMMEELRRRPGCSEIPAIALTGFGQRGDVERAHAVGFSEHVTKPVSLEKLISVARKVVKQRTLGI